MKTKTKKPAVQHETIAETHTRWLDVRNFAAVRGVFNFAEDDEAYRAYVHGDKDELQRIITARAILDGTETTELAAATGNRIPWLEVKGDARKRRTTEGTFLHASDVYHAAAAEDFKLRRPVTK